MTTPVRLPRLMDSQLAEVARLHPSRLDIDLQLTPLSTATMELPPDEPEVPVGGFVALYGPDGSEGVFRVAAVETEWSGAPLRRVRLEHALCTLGDGLLFGYHLFDGLSTRQVLEQLLSRQPVKRWVLGDCAIDADLSYTFENGSLLEAVLSLLTPLPQPCALAFDFTTVPWTLHLRCLSTDVASECRLSRNLSSLSMAVDRTDLCTRIYPLGYGEGADQLTIRDVNGGVPYLDADTIGQWGVAEAAYADTTITDEGTLRSAALAMLDRVKNPVMTLDVAAIELSAETGVSIDRFRLGTLCRVILPGMTAPLSLRVIALRRPDALGDPMQIQLTLSNRADAASADIARLLKKSLVSEVYSQGAASQFCLPFADNADSEHPAVMRFYLDKDAVHVNAVKVKYALEPFRGYTKAQSGGGGHATVSSEEKLVSSGTSGAIGATGTDQSLYGTTHHYHNLIRVNLPAIEMTLPSHTHPMALGIYEGETASGVAIQVDGTTVPSAAISGGEFDACAYLSKDSRGKIRRGAWHEIRFTPTGQTRVAVNVYVRTFLRSLTGANL